MNPGMVHELFPPDDYGELTNVACVPPVLYGQDLDWTCALACLRSICSGILEFPSDADVVRRFGLRPGPIYSGWVKSSGILSVTGVEAAYGCDFPDAGIPDLWRYLRDGWRVMVNWMYSFDHWTVLMAYMALGDDPDYHDMLHWDPYCGEQLHVKEGHFSVMWKSGGTPNEHDFVAVRHSGAVPMH